MKLEDLRRDIRSMTFEEQLEKIRQIREERRSFAPASPAKVKRAAAAKATALTGLMKKLQGLSPEQIQALLGTGEGEENADD